jgi:hypothetical protein
MAIAALLIEVMSTSSGSPSRQGAPGAGWFICEGALSSLEPTDVEIAGEP